MRSQQTGNCTEPVSQERALGKHHMLIGARMMLFVGPPDWVDRFGDGVARKGSDILVQALERQGVDQVFAYPGGASMEIHQALTRSEKINNILCRHEQVGLHVARSCARPASACTLLCSPWLTSSELKANCQEQCQICIASIAG